MSKAMTCCLLLAVAVLTVCAAAAVPADEAITPARTRISFTSTDSVLTLDATFGSGRTRCPTAELTATTDDAGTSMSGRATFSGNTAARTTCTDVVSGNSVTVSCPGLIGVSDTVATSVRGTNTSGDLVLSGSPVCSVTNTVTRGTINVDPQTVRSCVTIRENTTLAVNCTIAVTSTGARRSGTATFVATYSTATNLSIS